MTRYFIAGGAGFIGSHMTRHLVADAGTRVTVYDNFSSGREWHLEQAMRTGRVEIIRGDIKELPYLTRAMRGHDHVYHFASNPDIARAMTQPDVDFWEGTYLTQNILEAMRVAGVPRLTYASGSGVYGDCGTLPVSESSGPGLFPVSTYGASKLAGEAMICAYCHMFGLRALAFRFANVVGPHQTHGVTYDFVRRLLADPKRLRILGDGNQSKSYIHVEDVIGAMRFVARNDPDGFDVFNVSTEDYVTVREIAELVVQRLKLGNVAFEFTGGPRGWAGDVPVVRFDTQKLRSAGWKSRRTSVEALLDSINSTVEDVLAGRIRNAA